LKCSKPSLKQSCYSYEVGAVVAEFKGLTNGHVACRAGRLDIPQGLHEGCIHLNVAIGHREMLEENRRLNRTLDRVVDYQCSWKSQRYYTQ